MHLINATLSALTPTASLHPQQWYNLHSRPRQSGDLTPGTHLVRGRAGWGLGPGILQLSAVPAASLLAAQSTSWENAFNYHLAQRGRFMAVLSSGPKSSTPLGSGMITIGIRMHAGVGGRGMLASHMFVAPEGSEQGVGMGVRSRLLIVQ